MICKFFQQGICRYGNTCRYEHVASDYSPSGDSGFRGRYTGHHYQSNNYYSSHNKHPGSYKVANNSHDVQEVMKIIVQEVIQSENGRQWPLSCFGPIKERQCFPGWEDHSPEEIRWKMYEALKNGTLLDCQRQIKELYEAAKIRRNSILHPNEEVYKIVEKIMHGQELVTETNFSFVQAANQTATNKFSLWNSPAFNNQQQSTVSNNFTFSLPQFGGSVNQSAVQQSPSIFGTPVQPLQTVINVPNQIQSVPDQTSSVSSQMPSVFSNPSQVQNSSFGNVPQNFPAFQQPAQPQVSAPNTGPVFGVSNSVFNKNSAVSNKIDNSVDSSLYTPKTDLTNDELNAFLAQTFTMGKVPTKPPPRELCSI